MAGDCEDYAIVKYAALLAAGFPKDLVKIIVWRNRMPDEEHAVVAVWVDAQWLILDQRTLALVPDTSVTRVIPEFVLGEDGVRRFVASGPKAAATQASLTSGWTTALRIPHRDRALALTPG
jgi:hypothetical protein